MKRVLFIGPRFYNYHEVIKRAFENEGFEVDYFDDRPGTGFITKMLVRLNKNLIKSKTKKYFEGILAKAKQKQYDVVFVLYGQAFDRPMMERLKEALPKSEFIFYMYDPISSMPDRVQFAEVFDHKFSFDYEDVKRYPQFKLLPLFYSKMDIEEQAQKYDACFVGTMMPGKYKLVHGLVGALKEHGYSVFDYEFVQSKLVALYYKLCKKEFRHAKIKEFSYNRMTNKRAYEVFASSKYILDCPKEGQTGLTIRVFESLALKRKLITTNPTIVNYDFYCPQNVYVYQGGEINFQDEFFKTDFKPIDEELLKKYSVESWLKTLLADIRTGE